jgi:hypothetical protein
MNIRARRLLGPLVAVMLACDATGNCFADNAGGRRKVIIDQDTFGPASSNLQAILMVLQARDVEVPKFERMTLDLLESPTPAH